MGCDLKPFEAIQRVRPPPGKGAARQPEASLAWETVTSLVKRRQRMLKPCVSLEIMCPLRPSVWVARGQHRQDRQGEILSARPGSWSRAKAWNGSPGNLRDPACVHVCSTPVRERRLIKCSRPDGFPPKPQGSRYARAGSRSTPIVPRKAGNRAGRDPLEGRRVPRGETR